MNPWQFLRREIDGAARSLRYDLSMRRAAGQAKRQMSMKTMELPIIAPPLPGDVARKRRVLMVTSGALVITAAVSGYFAVGNSFDALIGGDGATSGLPDTLRRPQKSPPPSPAPSGTAIVDTNLKIPVAQNSHVPPPPRTTPGPGGGTPPVPTPAPTCSCVTPAPTPSGTPSASPTPTPTPSHTPSASPSTSPPPAPSAAAPSSAATR